MKFGNSVGLAPFKNTNRKDAKYTRRANRLARSKGFVDMQAMTDFFLRTVLPAQVKQDLIRNRVKGGE
jgi:hypothetical protein